MTELRTARLLLRPARPDDAPCYALGVSEFAVARWLTHLPWPYTLSMASDWLRQAPVGHSEQALFIIEVPGKGLIGCLSLADELGFWIARPHWGRGYLTEAASAMINWHFARGPQQQIRCSAQADNKPSLRVQAKLGFVECGRDMRFSQALQHNVPHVVTQLTRSDWLARGSLKCA
ncbi:GNAT family N-acetyltransferase [Devosia chinhatensis]|uniref:N-acetyltransferase domain-containing protein n=1 Tax=Devosia chinhatensis TaxID=429727 RepID=A0A0F5FGF2_9HYPH|nr:GNAT family N-acetyltransferase [Devosia chinhatensis]KKB07645.1 hypothetical protein VE26_13230 [Devosia chinhatensis]